MHDNELKPQKRKLYDAVVELSERLDEMEARFLEHEQHELSLTDEVTAPDNYKSVGEICTKCGGWV